MRQIEGFAMTTRAERLELWGEKLHTLVMVAAFLILWACFTGLLGPLGLLVGWLPAIFLAPFAAPDLVLLGGLAVAYGVVVLAIALAVVWLA